MYWEIEMFLDVVMNITSCLPIISQHACETYKRLVIHYNKYQTELFVPYTVEIVEDLSPEPSIALVNLGNEHTVELINQSFELLSLHATTTNLYSRPHKERESHGTKRIIQLTVRTTSQEESNQIDQMLDRLAINHYYCIELVDCFDAGLLLKINLDHFDVQNNPRLAHYRRPFYEELLPAPFVNRLILMSIPQFIALVLLLVLYK